MIAGYIRESTSEQILGIEAQRNAILAKYPSARLYVDAGVSGRTNKRPALLRLRKDIEAGEIDGVVIVRLDRLMRSLGHLCELLAFFKQHDCTLVSLDGSIDLSTPMGRAMCGIAGVFAQLESELIGARTKEAMLVAAQKGVRLGRPPKLRVVA